MNIGTYYDALPDADAALEVWPDGQNGESCLCVYGVTDAEVTSWFRVVNARAEELAQNALEVTVKPLLWFDSRETALAFQEFANGMEETDFCELILEMQRSYNTPWTSAQQLDMDLVQRIIDNWERRRGDDRS